MSLKTLLQRATVVGAYLLITGTALAISTPVANANVLGNPGFESPVIPVGGPPEYYGAGDSWTSFGGGIYTIATFVVAPNAAHSGSQLLKTFGGCCSGAFQQFPAVPGQTWNGGVWMLNSVSDPMASGQVAAVNIEWIRADGVTQVSFISNGTFTGASTMNIWTLQTITGVAPPDAAFARLVVITGDFLAPLPPGGAPFFDDAFFELVPPTTTKGSSWGQIKTIYR